MVQVDAAVSGRKEHVHCIERFEGILTSQRNGGRAEG